MLRQGGRTLDNNQQFRIIIHDLGDFKKFSVLHVKAVDHLGRINLTKPNRRKDFPGGFVHPRTADHTRLTEAVFLAEKNILGDRYPGYRALFLYNHADTRLFGPSMVLGLWIRPLKYISPEVAGWIPAAIDEMVDLPEPFSPISPVTSPRKIFRSTLFRATVGPKFLQSFLVSKIN
jgi:hypothetical protein